MLDQNKQESLLPHEFEGIQGKHPSKKVGVKGLNEEINAILGKPNISEFSQIPEDYNTKN